MPREIKLKLLRSRSDYPAEKTVFDPMRFYYYPFFGRLYRRRVEMCLAELAGGENILEVGFGSGLTFLNLAESYKAIWGIDLESDCERVQKHFAGMGINCHLTHGSILKLPYEDNFFDSVLLISIMEHLKPAEQDVAFAEIRRVLKPSGRLVLIPLAWIWGKSLTDQLAKWLFRVTGQSEELTDSLASRIRSVFAEAGFRVEMVQTEIRHSTVLTVIAEINNAG